MTIIPPDSTQLKLIPLPVQLIESPGGVIIKRGCSELRIRGDGAEHYVRAVLAAADKDGATREEICHQFAAPHRPVVNDLIDTLVARRILVPAGQATWIDTGAEAPLDIFYWHFDQSAGHVAQALNTQRLAVLGVNYISRQLTATLVASGWESFQVVDDPCLRNVRLFDEAGRLRAGQWPSHGRAPLEYKDWLDKSTSNPVDCLIATSDFGAQETMRLWNRLCVERRCHFLPVVLQNLIGYLGPLVIPGETACFECLWARQNSHLEDIRAQRAAESVAFAGQAVNGFHPSMASILGDLAAFELTRFYIGALPPGNVGTLIEVNLLASGLTARKVLKIPRCAVCSPLLTRPSKTPLRAVWAAPERPDT